MEEWKEKYKKLEYIGRDLTKKNIAFYKYFYEELWGIVNEKGIEITPPLYNDISNLERKLFAVKKGSHWGYVNLRGKKVIPLIYQKAEPFYEHVAAVKKNELWGFIDTKGKVVNPFKYDAVDVPLFGYFNVKLSEKSGLVDSYGKEVVPCNFEVVHISKGNFLYVKNFSGKWGIYQVGKKQILSLKYRWESLGSLRVLMDGEPVKCQKAEL